MREKNIFKRCIKDHLQNTEYNKGITLIALVVTIIVLLILAGITINVVLGEDGIIAQTQNAKKETKVAEIEESIEFAKAGSIDKETFKMNPDVLVPLLEGIDGVDDVTVEGNKVKVKYAGDREKEIDIATGGTQTGGTQTGGSETGGGKTVLTTEKEFKDKIESDIDLTKDIVRAYDAYGDEIENFADNWYYELKSNNKEWRLNEYDRYQVHQPGYKGEIVGGTIIGQIPAYIVKVEDGKITNQGPIVEYCGLFDTLKEITYIQDDIAISPLVKEIKNVFRNTNIDKIPKCFMTYSDNVTKMEGIFSQTKITEIPPEFKIGKNVTSISSLFEQALITKVPASLKIPDSVKKCTYMFSECKNLTEVENGFKLSPNITDIHSMFQDCQNLTYINITIPLKVTNIKNAFYQTYNLDNKSHIIIEGNPSEYEKAFTRISKSAKTETGVNIHYKKSICTNIEKIKETIVEGKATCIDDEAQ